MIIDGVKVVAEGFDPSPDEMKNYVEYTRGLVPNVDEIKVAMCPDGKVNVNYVAHHQKFERIRRITGM